MAYAALIGAEVKRREDPRLVQGQGTYVSDLRLPGMLYVAIARSPYAHARIVSIDKATALTLPGVVAVYTGTDLLDLCQPLPLASSGEGGSGPQRYTGRTRYVLAVERVRHVGEAVAAVVAHSPEAALDAALALAIEWEPLPAVVDPLAAIDPAAPVIFEDLPDNIDHRRRRQKGDVEAAFASAHRVVRQRMVNQRLLGFPMEGRAVVAAPDPTNDGVTLWTSTQTPHQVRGDVARVIGLDENRVRVIAPDVGGGFGVKIGIYPEEALLAALARQLHAPLRWVEHRLEHVQATTHGRGQVCDIEAAVTAEGEITALRMRIVADLGAYPLAPGLPDLTTAMAVGVYKIPAVDLEAVCVYTNTTPVAAYRGAGRPEAAYYIERLMDLVAAELNLDPAEVRRRNFIPPDAFPYKTPTGLTYDSGEYDRALTKALSLANYEQLRAEQAARRAAGDRMLLGIGIACYVEMCGFGPYESAQIKVEPSGTVTVTTGISPHGQGTATTFAQIVADQIGADFNRIVVKHSDTALTPMGIGTMGSRSLAVGGAALVRAATKVREKARQIAAAMLEANVADIEFHEGRYVVRGVPDRGLTLTEIARRAYSNKLPPEIDPGLEAVDYFRPADLIYPFGAHVAVVEVDSETGHVRIRDYYSVDDCGPRISPLIVTGQVHGGLAQGIAQALLEEVVYDANGQLLSGTLMDYAVPRADLFPPFTVDKTETPTPLNPLGVKGIGEAATIGSTPAITNAVIDALQPFGVRHIDIPLRPEKVWRAINNGHLEKGE
ncbi:MAG TPA: carbon monoxide dehydrogenase [Chloroflexus aurantiacus]|jgi:carbon-monoxide dehydrogenase large subunit|uniref:Aldehyde oxidase and xanthine dehydrogenase molybdopterin binding n=1 Tax=Chloroflexus aurantiacus (strain ATCC 29366 / DSM 635 / J-10-fl) TaxID=324602 RepID=A9WF02_CHLAA|nr:MULTISPECIES: molybdopterin cofactor-binding domain-containing protein [Chloroflexus]ABY35317.1 aldehyde oxidase and xanthine dehydrogenase molybdopterin binding [Chloroflexus aurantiacus J-10-fl]RMG45996.1 MAG: xanthine dehydrogenase family protein molybdopterin-binding subunit [Chloroflexota bacterium]GIV92268.1 MAG: aldehyde dehydrogenase [Chloroflexus sp.]HBW66493.1 carbon monoxide dehydrogenase [Chloroflexus aurantiacus]